MILLYYQLLKAGLNSNWIGETKYNLMKFNITYECNSQKKFIDELFGKMDNLENSFLDIKKLFLYYFIYTAQAKFSKIAGPAPPEREYVTFVPLKLTFWLMPKLYIHLRK